MSNLAVIPQFNLPPALASQFAALGLGADDLDAGVSAGFPVMSIRGAKWRIVEGGEEQPIYMPGTKDLAPSVKVVIMRANSALSKTFYAGQYVEGTDAKPDCSSNDGVAPSPDSPKPQCTTCAACPQNVWGSKVSPSGAKIKACADVRRVAILPAEDLGYSPILLRIPGASLGDLAAYGKALKQRGIPYAAVVTKLSFDPDASYPKILFQFERVLTQEEMTTVAERISDPVVDDVLGTSAPRAAAPAITAPAVDQFGIPANVAPPPAAAAVQPDPAPAAAAPAPAAEKKPRSKGFGAAPEVDEAAKQAAIAEAQAAAAAAKAQAAAPAPVQSAGDNMVDDIEAALANLNL